MSNANKKRNEWIAKTYDRINLTVPKGKKKAIQEYAKSHNTSVNKLIWNLIDAELHKEKEKKQNHEQV